MGALTSRDFRFQMRTWFLSETPSICPNCATGCNIFIHSRNAQIYRLTPRENDEVNSSWMCDSGRLNYKWVNDPRRLLNVLWKKRATALKSTGEKALQKSLLRSKLPPRAPLPSGLSTPEHRRNFPGKQACQSFWKHRPIALPALGKVMRSCSMPI